MAGGRECMMADQKAGWTRGREQRLRPTPETARLDLLKVRNLTIVPSIENQDCKPRRDSIS